jgi:AraC family transcriptional activator of pyochelin receptor
VRDCPLDGAAGMTLRGAKCVELFCETFAALVGNALVPTHAEVAMSECDTRRIVQARRVIDEQWREKLTLDAIARACGVNRAKLTRGYRALFGVTIADAIAERRLGGARQMLLATDLPVSSVGYACGYQNNASFTRAFSRRFGVVPTRLRAECLAA